MLAFIDALVRLFEHILYPRRRSGDEDSCDHDHETWGGIHRSCGCG
jgi:hypothetical protein